jgi:chromosomal replication initiator protein
MAMQDNSRRRGVLKESQKGLRKQQFDTGFPFDEGRSLAAFVAGDCNRLACSAAAAVAESPGKIYNPLYIAAGVGMGKTHLLRGICGRFSELHPGQAVVYVPAQQFVAEFVRAVRDKSTHAFHERYRALSLLALDDVQALSGKTRSQEEFFHTFNELHSRRAQIVIAGDRLPQEIPDMPERLVSRLCWGLVVSLDEPSAATRLDILRQKAKASGVDVPPAVLEYVAEHAHGSIRELEGVLVRVLGLAALRNRRVDEDIAREALHRSARKPLLPVRVENILSAVAKHFDVSRRDLLSKKRPRAIALPRQVGMYLARVLTDRTLEAIGELFGGRDHTTVLYAFEKLEKARKTDRTLASAIDKITADLGR